MAKSNYHVHQMHLHNDKIKNVFNGMTHHILWKTICISKMLYYKVQRSNLIIITLNWLWISTLTNIKSICMAIKFLHWCSYYNDKWSWIDVWGNSKTLCVIGCGKIELPYPPNAPTLWWNGKYFQWNDTSQIMEDHLYFQDFVM